MNTNVAVGGALIVASGLLVVVSTTLLPWEGDETFLAYNTGFAIIALMIATGLIIFGLVMVVKRDPKARPVFLGFPVAVLPVAVVWPLLAGTYEAPGAGNWLMLVAIVLGFVGLIVSIPASEPAGPNEPKGTDSIDPQGGRY